MHNGEHPVRLYHHLLRQLHCPQPITGSTLPALQDTYSTRCHRKAKKIIKDINHLSDGLFTPITIQKVRSVQVHQSWDRETEKQLVSQGHQTGK